MFHTNMGATNRGRKIFLIPMLVLMLLPNANAAGSPAYPPSKSLALRNSRCFRVSHMGLAMKREE